MGFLAPYRVLDLTDERGLLAGRMLADLGADVVQVEPPGGSSARSCVPTNTTSGSYFFDAYAANKRGIVADLDSDAGQRLLRDLARSADFLIESADPGVMQRRGLDWPDLREVNPRLIYVSITAFGRTGPKAQYAATDLTVWAAGGPLDTHRDGDRPPLRISIPQAFLHASADATGGALLAHHARLRTGRGQHVDVSAQASLTVATLGQVLADAVGDEEPSLERRFAARIDQSGSGSRTPPEQKKWPCRDGMVEFHLGVGPASGNFSAAFVRWMVEEGHGEKDLLDIEWRTVPADLAAGTFPPEKLDDIRTQIATFLAGKSKEEVLEAAAHKRLLCVPIYDTGDVARSRQLDARGFWFDTEGGSGPQYRVPGRFAQVSPDGFRLRRPAPVLGEHTADVVAEWAALGTAPGTAPSGPDEPSARSHPPSSALPMAGLKVLDLSWIVAGPLVGRALADFGATVVRVESSTRLDATRLMPPFYQGEAGIDNSGIYETCNAGKLGITMDLGSEEGRDIVRELAGWSDVVVESYSPGQMAAWGLDYQTLSAGHKGLIMLSTSLVGQTGPYSRLAGYGNIGAALSGFQEIVGWPDRPPVGPFGPYTDYLGPRMSLATLLAALDCRERTGEGCYIDVSQIEAGVYFQSPELAAYLAEGEVIQRIGNADRRYAPHGVYPCRSENGRDRFVAIAVRDDSEWRRLCEGMGRADLAADPDLSTAPQRREQSANLDLVLGEWTSMQFAHDVEALLQRAQVAAHVSASSHDVCTDPQLTHRGHFVRVPHPAHGEAIVEGPRYQLSETPGQVARAAPTLGQHNEDVVRDILGYSPARIAGLVERRVLR